MDEFDEDDEQCCIGCGDVLNEKEIEFGEDMCFPCLKGNR